MRAEHEVLERYDREYERRAFLSSVFGQTGHWAQSYRLNCGKLVTEWYNGARFVGAAEVRDADDARDVAALWILGETEKARAARLAGAAPIGEPPAQS